MKIIITMHDRLIIIVSIVKLILIPQVMCKLAFIAFKEYCKLLLCRTPGREHVQ